MGTYVMSDIHGCYDRFLHMLDKIGFSATDRLILAGDCIDRGSKAMRCYDGWSALRSMCG